jgi:CubicO group peptidase (beta-lactamase class C family)
VRVATVATFALAVVCANQSAALAAKGDQQRVDRLFVTYDKTSSPGCALGVIRDGNFIYRKAYGMASLELGVPLSPRAVFYMGSVAKQFTAASVVLAAEQGFLSLDDDVRNYIPELPDYGHPITLRQMLHHTSGFRDFLTLLDISGRHESDLHSKEEMLDLIVRQTGLNNIPGDEYIYSNTNYFLLGEVLQRATKKSLADFAAENIFQPLRMADTRFYDEHTLVLPGRVPAYDPGSDGSFVVDWSTNYDTVGGGGLMSSVDDLLLWDRNVYQNKLGSGTLLKEMQTRGVLNNGKQIDYALGLELGAIVVCRPSSMVAGFLVMLQKSCASRTSGLRWYAFATCRASLRTACRATSLIFFLKRICKQRQAHPNPPVRVACRTQVSLRANTSILGHMPSIPLPFREAILPHGARSLNVWVLTGSKILGAASSPSRTRTASRGQRSTRTARPTSLAAELNR